MKNYKKNNSNRVFINNQIRAKEVRLITEDGQQIGVTPISQAISMAEEKGLDLVQVTEKVSPPVCKIADYGKYLYQLKKKEKKPHKKGGETKGIRLKFKTGEHDLLTKAKQSAKFLEQGNRVKIDLILRGREKALRNQAQIQINKFLDILKEITPIEIDQPSKKNPRGLSLIIKKGHEQTKDKEISKQKVQSDQERKSNA